MKYSTRVLALLVASIATFPAAAPAKFDLSVDSIMRGPTLVGYPPDSVRWAGDSKDFWFEWRQPGDTETSTWIANVALGSARKLSDEERKQAPPQDPEFDADQRRALFASNGDIAIVDTITKEKLTITRIAGVESRPHFAMKDTHVTFLRDGGLFLAPVAGAGGLVQLFESGPKKKDPTLTDSQKTVRDEEAKLLEIVKRRAEERKKREEKRDADALPRLEIAEGETVQDGMLSPDGTHAIALVSTRATAAKTADVPNYITESSYPEPIPARTRVGDAQDKRRLAILNLKTRKQVWATLSALRTETKGSDGKSETKDRPARWSSPVLSTDGKSVIASVRADDNKDRWLVSVDPESGDARILFSEHDDAWLRELFGGFGFIDDKTLWFTSEKSGYMHLYAVDTGGAGGASSEAKQLTSGNWEIDSVRLSKDKKTFFITSTEASAAERHLYSMPVTGGVRTRLTTATGAHAATVAPDGVTAATIYSAGNRPPDVYVGPLTANLSKRVTTSPSAEWSAYPWLDPKVITFTARDGAKVPARIFRPEDVGAKQHPARPAVIFVHGAGYLQNAHRYWSTYFREYMFHHVLASKGYVVLDVDYRASAGYGRDWRTGIYRFMGGKDLEDIVDGARYLAKEQGVDPKRIGVYGGSYGGFITLMGMFTTPGVFAAGAALRPVTDWAHYNHGYTSNILNLPQSDAEAYKKSSPIYHAQGLQGALLICHGVVDTNVHFSDSVRLAQRLIELRKDNWEIAPYPVEDHGFVEETSWADEYRRILKLFERELKK